jgi:hypothetical protein
LNKLVLAVIIIGVAVAGFQEIEGPGAATVGSTSETSSSSTKSITSSTSIASIITSGLNYSICLIQVPTNVSIEENGAWAIFPNGTEEILSFFTCQRFVHPDEYQAVMTVADNPAFIAAEGGFLYTYYGGILPPYGGFQYSSVNGTETCSSTIVNPAGGYYTQGCFVSTGILFDLWSSTETVPGCDGSTLSKQLGEIQVLIPLNATGDPNLSNITVETIPSGFLNLVLCTTQITLPPTTTVTVTPTITITPIITTTITPTITITANDTASQSSTSTIVVTTVVSHQTTPLLLDGTLLAVLAAASVVVAFGVMTLSRRRQRPGLVT